MSSTAGPEIYSSDYYRRIAATEHAYWWHRGMRAIQAALLASCPAGRPCRRALDAGCGPGGTMSWLRETVGAEWVSGIDIAPAALHLCRRGPDRNVLQASVLSLPFADDSFDLVICLDVIQHLPTDGGDVRGLREIHRVLAPGGRLLVRANSRQGMWQRAGERDEDFQRYLLPEVVAACEAAGFMVERATYANVLPAVYASLKRRIELRAQIRTGARAAPNGRGRRRLYEGLPLRGPDDRLPAWLNQILSGLLGAEARYLSAAGRRLPFGHTTLCLGRKSGR